MSSTPRKGFFSNFVIFKSLMKIFQKIENLVLLALEKNIFPIFWSENSKIVGEKNCP